MVASYDYTWQQGEDLLISLVYKLGPSGSEAPVDLTSYKLRMDIAGPQGDIITVLNDESITDTDPFTAGNQSDTSYEVTLGAAGQISINLSRSLTLPGSRIYSYVNANPEQKDFAYDIFLRDAADKQRKILQGTITVEKSVTKWT